jgi:hypothetical protein
MSGKQYEHRKVCVERQNVVTDLKGVSADEKIVITNLKKGDTDDGKYIRMVFKLISEMLPTLCFFESARLRKRYRFI